MKELKPTVKSVQSVQSVKAIKMKQILHRSMKIAYEKKDRSMKILDDMVNVMNFMREIWSTIRVHRIKCARIIKSIILKEGISLSTNVHDDEEEQGQEIPNPDPLYIDNVVTSEIEEIKKLEGMELVLVVDLDIFEIDPTDDHRYDKIKALEHLMCAVALKRNYSEVAKELMDKCSLTTAAEHVHSGYTKPMSTTLPHAIELAEKIVHTGIYDFPQVLKRVDTYMDCGPDELIERLDDAAWVVYNELRGFDEEEESEELDEDVEMDEEDLRKDEMVEKEDTLFIEG